MIPADGPFVLDASAVLALLFDEPGAALVESCLDDSVMSSVNVAEVLARIADGGTPPLEAERSFLALGCDVRPMTYAQSRRSAQLRPLTRFAGLSLGDRVCLALAQEIGMPILTADRQWPKIAIVADVTIGLIR